MEVRVYNVESKSKLLYKCKLYIDSFATLARGK